MPQVSSDEGGRESRRRGDAASARKHTTANMIAAGIDRWLFIFLMAGLVWAPLWLGGNRLFPWTVNALLFPGLALIYESTRLATGTGHHVGLKYVGTSAFLLAVVVAFIFVQMSTLAPPGWVHPVWTMAAEVLGEEYPVRGSISVNRSLTALALVRLLTEASVFWLTMQLCRDAHRSGLLVRCIALTAAAYSLIGLFLFTFSIDVITPMGGPKTPNLSSTFVNRNSYATYAGLGLLCQMSILLRMYRHEVETARGVRSLRIAKFLEVTGERGWLWIAAAGVTVMGLMVSASRGGVMATVFGMFVLILLSFSRPNRRRANQFDVVLVLVAVAVGMLLVFGDGLLSRMLGQEGLVDLNRVAIYTITIRSIMDSPWLGFGYGTFVDVFPIYRDRSIPIDGVLDKAHNTYLEIFQGLGILFGPALILSVALIVLSCYRGLVRREQNASVPILATSAAALVGVHALVDFSIQIQAVTLVFMALLGAGLAQSVSSRESMKD